MNGRLLRCSVAVGALVLGAMAVPAHAQDGASGEPDAADTADASGEIVVTARRREESLSKVPAAITAFSQDDLIEKEIRQYNDLQFNTPSLTVSGSFGHTFGGYSIRGLGANLFGQPTVASYFAEVATLTPNVGGALFDVENVQVLKGPQGTLFGRASTAGAVLVTPAKPVAGEFDAGLRATVGNLGLVEVEAFLNLPVADDFAARIAVKRQHRDGYTRAIAGGQKLDGLGNLSIRASAEWKPANSWFSTYSVVEYDRIDQSAPSQVLAGYNPGLALFNLPNSSSPLAPIFGPALFGAVCAQAVNFGFSPNATTCQNQRLDLLAQYKPELEAEMTRIAAGGDALRYAHANPGFPLRDEAENWSFINTTTADLGDLGFSHVTLKNIFGYQMARAVTSTDLSGIPSGLLQAAFSNSYGASSNQSGNTPSVGIGPYTHLYTNEFQISGATDNDTLVWLLGFYYQNAPVTRSVDGVRNLSRAFSGAFTPNLGFTSAYPFNVGGYERQLGQFGQFTLDLSVLGLRGLHFTAGARASQDRSRIDTVPAVASFPSGNFAPGTTVTSSKTKSSGTGWTFALDAQVTDDLLLYATARRGYNPGGQNLVVGASTLPNFSPVYGPEVVKDIEIGAKYNFVLEGVRGGINLAAYRQNYSNIQRTFRGTVNGASVAYTGNVAGARLQGVEVEAKLLFGRNLELSGQYSYNDAYYTEWLGGDPFNVAVPGQAVCVPPSTPTSCVLDLTDNPFARNAKHKGSATLRYRLPVAESAGDVHMSVTAYGQSRIYFTEGANRAVALLGPQTRDQISQSGFGLINARLEWSGILGSNVDGALFVQNLTDRTYALSGTPQLFALGIATKSYAAPRTYGVQLSYRFGN